MLEELGLIKMSIFNNQIRHLVDVIRKSKHASSKLSKFEESIISVNCTDIFNANTVIILLKTYRDKSKLLILVLRIMAEYFDAIKVNDNSNDDNFCQMLCIGKGLKELLNITIIDTNKNYATNENIKVNISGYLEI
ncbi:MAG: hypothetical protein Q7U23_13310 [Methylococcales bacterium]|nr:hypothetical protein [Methylococcales bacterium]